MRGVVSGVWKSGRGVAVICFALFSGWMLAIPFEGKTLYLLGGAMGISGIEQIMKVSVFLNFAGLFLCGFIVKQARDAQRMLRVLIPVCMAGTLLLLVESQVVWCFAISVVGFSAGMVVACWGFWFLSETPVGERFPVAAEMLLLSNVLMIPIDAIGLGVSAWAGIASSLVLLAAAFALAGRLNPGAVTDPALRADPAPRADRAYADRSRSLAVLSVFVAVITINSGIMYSLILPAFTHHTILMTWYWAVPYIGALLVFRKRMNTGRRFGILMLGVGLSGLSFILFSLLDRSALAFILIDTLMLGAFGVCDLFWWGTLGEMLEQAENPARVLGLGLSANVFGILVGQVIVGMLERTGRDVFFSPNIAAVVVMATIVSVPYLYKQLHGEMDKQEAAAAAAVSERHILMGMSGDAQVPGRVRKQLTERETEIVKGLLRGKTYKMVSDELGISENTTKYHIKSIYTKLGIHNKTELLNLIGRDQKIETRR